jgi:CheY-like chemotaxis protein
MRPSREADVMPCLLPGEGPAERTVTSEFEAVATSAERGGKLCLLIVASKLVNAEALRELLSGDQRRVEIAISGPEALRLADRIQPNMILCDLQLPGTPSAYAFAQSLRSDPLFEPVYLIGLASNAIPAHTEFAMRSGFDQVLPLAGDTRLIEELIDRLRLTEER